MVCGYKTHGEVTEMRFSLLKKSINQTTEICTFSYTTNYKPVTVGNDIQCEGFPGPKNVTLHMSGLQTEDTGTYICRLEVMYPPPYLIREGNATFVYVSDLISECAQTSDPQEPIMFEWTLAVICAVIFLYSIIVTCILLFSKLLELWYPSTFIEQ
ncbi:cytotoxic T-lymphocyte 4 [Pelobates cultripes]|uniref:Cytotoxic T-lymphocyte 4 n=1 Tax=Pelobates cultripes TaxID=61616 RepID=A0AAD1SME7_PELCU|nr:cytotoxic T-lymphocyte 4 [Pelobates cultripes]